MIFTLIISILLFGNLVDSHSEYLHAFLDKLYDLKDVSKTTDLETESDFF